MADARDGGELDLQGATRLDITLDELNPGEPLSMITGAPTGVRAVLRGPQQDVGGLPIRWSSPPRTEGGTS